MTPAPSAGQPTTAPGRGDGRRILLVVGLVAGGAGRHVHELASGLHARGNRVVVACPDGVEAQFRFREAGAVVEAVRINARPHPGHDLAAVRTLGRLAAGAEVIHAHGLRAGALAALAPRSPAPLVVTLHNAAPTSRHIAAVFRLLEGVVARRADRVLGVSADLVDRMAALGAHGTDLAVVPAPAPTPQPAGTRERTRVALGLPAGRSGPVLAVVVARLAEQKGLPVLLDALEQLQGTDLDLRVLVAGDGPLRDGLQRRIDARALPVQLLGQRPDVPALLTAADLAISSAHWEGQPVWIQEALQTGLPIVATDAGGTGAVVADAGRLGPPGGSTALAEAIREVAGDAAVRGELRLRARRRAAELPTVDDAVEAALEAYELP